MAPDSEGKSPLEPLGLAQAFPTSGDKPALAPVCKGPGRKRGHNEL